MATLDESKKFHNLNNAFITSKENINYLNIQEYMKLVLPKLEEGSKIFFICGIHHNPDGSFGETDPTLLSSFYETNFSNLENYCGDQDCINCQDFVIKEHTTGARPR